VILSYLSNVIAVKERYALPLYLVGAVTARTGDEMSGPALLLAGLAVTGSVTAASSLLAGITISAAVGGPVFGVLLDRSARPGRLLALALALYASALTVILASLGHTPVAVTVLIAVCAGLLGPALSGGWTSQVPRVVRVETLPRANGLDAMTFSLASLVGPALAGTVAGLFGATGGVAVSIALICLALPSAWGLPGRDRSAPPSTSIVADLTAGARAILRTWPLARATVVSVISCAGAGMLITCAPLLGERVLGGPAHGAILLSAIAASALLSNAVLSLRPHLMRPDTVIWCSTLVLAAAPLLATPAHPGMLIAAALLTGMGEGPQLTALFAARHREAPDHLRGQIFTTGASLKLTAFALGTAIAGPIATWSLQTALLTAAGFQALAALTYAAITVSNSRAIRAVRR
jgi:MFS family permease